MFIIKYNGIFEYGSVRFYLFFKPKKHKPTKFRFKWMAQLLVAKLAQIPCYKLARLIKKKVKLKRK